MIDETRFKIKHKHADEMCMSLRGFKLRILDLIVTCFCVALVCMPFVASSSAVESSINESTADVDLTVPQVGAISYPTSGSFPASKSGVVDGSFAIEMYTNASNGMKLVLSSPRNPALYDSKNSVNIPNIGSTPGAWSVAKGERGFGFSASGDTTLARFSNGAAWRGFNGIKSAELARKASPFPVTKVSVKLRAEYDAALASDAVPTATVYATAVVNL